MSSRSINIHTWELALVNEGASAKTVFLKSKVVAPAVISFGFAGIVSTRVGTTGFPFLLIVAVPFPGATISTPLIFLPVGSILFLTTPQLHLS